MTNVNTPISVGPSYVPAGSDLLPLITGKPLAPLYLVPKAAYRVSQTATIAADGVSIIGDNNPVVVTRTPGASSGIIVRGDGCEFVGLLPSEPGINTVSFRLYGIAPAQRKAAPRGTKFRDCQWIDGAADCAINVDAWADNVTVENCTFGVLNAQAIYATADDLRMLGCKFAGSNGEHPIRVDLNGSTAHRPVNVYIGACDVINQNGYGKEAIAIRECDRVMIEGGSIDGWLDLGQGNADANWHVRDAVVYNVVFKRLRTFNGQSFSIIQVRHDVDAVIESCTFPGSTTQNAITGDDRCHIYNLGNSYASAPPTGLVWKDMALVAATGKLVSE